MRWKPEGLSENCALSSTAEIPATSGERLAPDHIGSASEWKALMVLNKIPKLDYA